MTTFSAPTTSPLTIATPESPPLWSTINYQFPARGDRPPVKLVWYDGKRDGQANLKDSYATVRDGELWLIGCHIAPYAFSRLGGHEPERERKLLFPINL